VVACNSKQLETLRHKILPVSHSYYTSNYWGGERGQELLPSWPHAHHLLHDHRIPAMWHGDTERGTSTIKLITSFWWHTQFVGTSLPTSPEVVSPLVSWRDTSPPTAGLLWETNVLSTDVS